MNASLFVTGASGFLGTHFLDRLDPAGWRSITLLSRHELRLPAHLAQSGNVRVVQASLHEVDRYADTLHPDTCILHLAGLTGKADRPQFFSVNTHATGLLIRAAEAARVRGMLFVSTIAVSFRKRKFYHYAESKQQAERLLQSSSLAYCILRPTIILGAGSAIWNRFQALVQIPMTVPLPGNGKVLMQPIYVDDMVRVLMDFLEREDFNNQTLEIGGPEVLSMDDFVQRVALATTGQHVRILHLPLGLVLLVLNVLERIMADRLSVSSGQFASFRNNGIVLANEPVLPPGAPMLDVDAMLARLRDAEAA